MGKSKLFNAALAMILAMALAFFGCGKPPQKAVPKKPIKIGAIFSVTGRASFLGDPEAKTVEMLVEEINATGGINGRKLEVVILDDESDSTKCVLAAKSLIKKEKVPVIIGPSLSGHSMALIPIMQKAEVPLISCAARRDIIHPAAERKWIFKVPQTDMQAVGRIFAHIKSKGKSRVAIISVNTGFGAGGRNQLLAQAKGAGINIVADERYGPKDSDITAQLTKIKAKRPHAIINWSIGPTQVLVVRTWADLGMKNISLYQSHGFGSKRNIVASGGAAEGVMCPLGLVNIADLVPADNPQKKVIMKYKKDYEARYGMDLSSFGGHAWDALMLAVDAAKAVGDDPAKIRDYLETRQGFVGQHGVFNFSKDDHNGLTKDDFEMVVVKKDTWALAK